MPMNGQMSDFYCDGSRVITEGTLAGSDLIGPVFLIPPGNEVRAALADELAVGDNAGHIQAIVHGE